jgi:hypothetical protein
MDRSAYDVVVHLGLGVYDCFDKILIERGAINTRKDAPDAAGNTPSTDVCKSSGSKEDILQPSEKSGVGRKLDIMDGHKTASGYEVQVVGARPRNSYICNETNYDALQATNNSCEAGHLMEVLVVL